MFIELILLAIIVFLLGAFVGLLDRQIGINLVTTKLIDANEAYQENCNELQRIFGP